MTRWTTEEICNLYKIVAENGGPGIKAFRVAAAQLNKSSGSCERRYSRMTPDEVTKYEYGQTDINSENRGKPWKKHEDFQLYDLKINKNKTYHAISRIIGRSSTSCERRFQTNDWTACKALGQNIVTEISKEISEDKKNVVLDQTQKQKVLVVSSQEHSEKLASRIVDWLVGVVRADPDALKTLDRETFDTKLEKVFSNPDSHFVRGDVTLDFEEIRSLAMEQIDALGMTYPKVRELGQGRYVVVGDSHGKNTATGMFKLLNTINENLKPDYIIHVGDMSDDDDEISYDWKKFPNLIVVGSLPELHMLKKQVHQYDVVIKKVMLGNLTIENQYDSGDYVKKSVGRIDPLTVPSMAIVNTHRHEMHSHCAYKKNRIIMSPGCLCRRHTIRTVKQLIFKDGYPTTRQTHPHGYKKYNKQEQDSSRWEQGLIVVEVDDTGNAYSTLCRIKPTKLGNTTSYCGTIFGENKVVGADQRIFFNGDMQCLYQDPQVLDIQEQFCLDYKPDVHVNVGDLLNNQGLAHHLGGTNGAGFFVDSKGVIKYTDTMKEVAASRFIMKRMRDWAPKSHLVIGNHERFATDFAKKMPQLQELMSLKTLLDTDRMNIDVTNLGCTLDFGFMRFVHGDVKVWGGTGGSKLDKIAINYGRDTVMGHVHYPAVRSGGYSVPMSGLLNQDYNEVDASQWMQGFGYADIYDGQSFITVISIMDGHCLVNGRLYYPRDCSSWDVPNHKLRIDIEFNVKTSQTPVAQVTRKSKTVVAVKG
jgi:predicted phosphodiesterase